MKLFQIYKRKVSCPLRVYMFHFLLCSILFLETFLLESYLLGLLGFSGFNMRPPVDLETLESLHHTKIKWQALSVIWNIVYQFLDSSVWLRNITPGGLTHSNSIKYIPGTSLSATKNKWHRILGLVQLPNWQFLWLQHFFLYWTALRYTRN